ncbi:hypothetical protein [Clostridium ganghwense]|uniref:DUF4321 domain-containing protein n=1 Tax=Clostridium ganghwense TaxID=312089 RepID=A0ABT4CUJ9_9CLOT|nr:hypothetical protein [Clostridium ganghwense]MCY6372732.1 hypothetical protein [Clostridium ganghwense]
MLKIFGRLIGLKGEELRYDSENLVFIFISIIFFTLLGFLKAITKEDILKVETFIQGIYSGTNINLSSVANIAELQNNNLFSVIYLSIAFFLSLAFIILRFVYGIKLSDKDTEPSKSEPSNDFSN